MGWHQILHAALSLIFVIGLLFLTLWIFKYCEQKGLKSKLIKNLRTGRRLSILEKKPLDARSQLVLVRADDTEYLLLLGASGSLLLETKPALELKKDE